MSKIVSEATKMLKETALELERFNRVLDAMSRWGTQVLGHTDRLNDAANEYFEGLHKMRNGVYRKMCHNLADCFLFSGVDEGIKDLALEKLEGLTDEKYIIVNFLDTWGNVPSSWVTDDEETFRKELKESIQKAKGKR